MNNLVKLAANTDVLRRFARQHIWNAPHRTLGVEAEYGMKDARRLRRELRKLRGGDETAQSANHERITELTNFLNYRRRLAAAADLPHGDTAYDHIDDHIVLHGRGAGPLERLQAALHENNERGATRRIERAMGRTFRSAEPMPRVALEVLQNSSHVTPSVPLRDINIANTATGAGSDRLREFVHDTRLMPRGRGISELEAMGEALPGARRIMQHAGVLPGAPLPETPRYVQYAQQRLAAGGNSPAVEQRLRSMVDTHAANTAAGPGRFNRNELRMIDDEFNQKFNPQFPQLLSRRVGGV